jgi:hypothetical protein
MADDTNIVDITDSQENVDLVFSVLTDVEKHVAMWMAQPLVSDDTPRDTAEELAEKIGSSRSSVYRASRRKPVRAAAKTLIAQSIATDRIPMLWKSVLTEGENDGKFGLQVLKFFESRGIDILMSPSIGNSGGGEGKGEVLQVPGGFEAALRRRSGE